MRPLLMSILIYFSTALALSSCNTSKELSKEQVTSSFVLSYGGGFAGKYDTYRLFDSGKVEKQNTDLVSYSDHKLLDLDSTKAIFHTLDDLNLENYSFDRSGNMTYKIEVEESRIRWSDSDSSVREDIRMFFARVWKLVNEEIK